jgi:hypothetical protein
MKLKLTILTVLALVTTALTYGQTTQFRYRVWIQNKHEVIQDIKTEKADTVKLPAGTVISSQKKYKIDNFEFTADIKDTLKIDTVILGTKDVPANMKLPGWATIAVDKDDKSKLHINYWLGDKYDRNGKYYLKLKNREYASFWFNCIEGGALTIPFKYRPKFTENNVDISDQFTADLNVGAYLGYSFGKIKYMYRKNEDKEPSKWLVSIGPFLSVSRVEIDSTTSLSATEPLKTKIAIATISPGIGVMTSIYNFRFGVYLGNDLAIGQTAQKWDYHNRWWLGFGIGYNIGLIWGATK